MRYRRGNVLAVIQRKGKGVEHPYRQAVRGKRREHRAEPGRVRSEHHHRRRETPVLPRDVQRSYGVRELPESFPSRHAREAET